MHRTIASNQRQFTRKLVQQPSIKDKITLVAGKADSFCIDRKVPVSYLTGTFDHFLTDQERMAVLRNIGQHLKPDGKIIFGIYLELLKESPLAPAGAYKIEGKIYRRFVDSRLLPDRKKEVFLVYEIFKDGKLIEKIEERSLVGLISRKRLLHILNKGGFDVKQEFSNYDLSNLKYGLKILARTQYVQSARRRAGGPAQDRRKIAFVVVKRSTNCEVNAKTFLVRC